MSLVGTRPILQDELRQYELHHRTLTIFRGLCRKAVQSRGELVRPCLQRRRSSRPRSSSSMQMITMAKKVSRLFMSIW